MSADAQMVVKVSGGTVYIETNIFDAVFSTEHAKELKSKLEAIFGIDLSVLSTEQLVSELRKRDGVEAIDVPAEGSYDLEVFGKRGRTLRNTILSEIDYEGSAIILRITD